MYCKHCGKQIADDSKFCPGCGGVQDGTSMPSKSLSTTNTSSNQLSPQATEIYLNDVLNLEVSIIHLNECDSQTVDEIEKTRQWGYGNDIKSPKRPEEPKKPPFPYCEEVTMSEVAEDNKSIILGICAIFAFFFFVFKLANVCTDYDGISDIEYGCNGFFLTIFLTAIFTAIVAGIVTFILWLIEFFSQKSHYKSQVQIYHNSTLPKHEKDKENYKIECDKYNEKHAVYVESLRERQKEADSKISTLNSKLATIREDRDTAENLLEQAYNANIIPKKYRGIYPVYFLYDYISSSGQSLENALLHCQLDNLESQLGTIIQTNYIMILQNAVQIAQNKQIIRNQERMIHNQHELIDASYRAEEQREKIISQNQAILEAERENASNSAEAAKYSRISAINSETTAFFSTYDHLK